MVFGDKSNDVTLNIGSITIKESTEEKLLGVILDKNLCFKETLTQNFCIRKLPREYSRNMMKARIT